jgi:hypothetical protein
MIRLLKRLIPAIAVVPVLAIWAGIAPAEEVSVTLTREDCQRLTRYVPDPGVAYQPGVDVNGRAVVPADLGSAPVLQIPETIQITIDVDLQDRLGFPANDKNFEADALLGVVTLGPDGRAWFNGQPLQDEAQYELSQQCQEILRHGAPRQ